MATKTKATAAEKAARVAAKVAALRAAVEFLKEDGAILSSFTTAERAAARRVHAEAFLVGGLIKPGQRKGSLGIAAFLEGHMPGWAEMSPSTRHSAVQAWGAAARPEKAPSSTTATARATGTPLSRLVSAVERVKDLEGEERKDLLTAFNAVTKIRTLLAKALKLNLTTEAKTTAKVAAQVAA